MPFAPHIIDAIDAIFRVAHEEGRDMLFEHEVYAILKRIGLDTPKFAFIDRPEAADQALLSRFDHHVILKVVSPDIAHKQKLGGVKKVHKYDPLFVQYVLERMTTEVRSRFSGDAPPAIRGYLLVEFIPHKPALGYEVLLGFREDDAFGPVMTLSKGGDDAEFFARHYDPANLFLPPLDPDRAKELVHGLKIRHKFEETGQLDCLNHFAKAAERLSVLAYRYSFIAPDRPEFIIRALDVNPFVVAEDGRFVAVDGFARFAPATSETRRVPAVRTEGLSRFFHPCGVAVAGVSTNPDRVSLGRNIAHLLHDMGRRDIHFVNPKGGKIRFGQTEYPLHRSLAQIPEPVDLVVHAAPARTVIDFLAQLPPDGPKAVILISGIPADMDYAEFTRRMDAVRPPGVRIIGPNCMGVFHAPDGADKGLNTLFVEEKRLDLKASPCSSTVLLTQSGAFSVTAIDKFRHSRLFRSVVSFGNKYDVKIPDLVAYFAADPDTAIVALYLEGLDPGEGRAFFQLARTIDKPIIAYKAGRTEAGARVTASHTASMSGSYDVFKAACGQAGVILAETITEHYHLVKVFSLLAGKPPGGDRVAGIVNAGFESAVGADELVHLAPAETSEETRRQLSKLNTFGLVDTRSAFLDITPMADDRMYADFVETMLRDPGVDCVFVSVVPHTDTLKTIAENCHDADGLAHLLVQLNIAYDKPMVISVNGGRYYQDFVSILEENGLPVFPDIRSAIMSLDAFVAHHLRFGGSRQGRRAGGACLPVSL